MERRILALFLIVMLLVNTVMMTSCDISGYLEILKGEDGRDGKDGSDGTDGINGTDGKDGVDGKDGADGVTPLLRINEEANYWEVSYDNGKSWTSMGVKATGENGKDGQDGKDGVDGEDGKDGVDGEDGVDGKDGADGVTPLLRINEETNYWEVSYDNGKSWTSMGVKATGENGKDGQDGKDGVTPLLRINEETNYWEVSYDNGRTWIIVPGQDFENIITTVSADEYKNLKKFIKWIDSEGKTVSTNSTYKHFKESNMELTAVYDDIDFVVLKGNSNWDSANHTLTSSKWTDINYVEFPLEKGMSITLEWTVGNQNTLGLATKEELDNPTINSWDIGTLLFAPEHNFYYATDTNEFRKIHKNGTYSYNTCSISWSKELIGQTVKVKYVLADTIEMYINDVLVTTTTTKFNFDYKQDEKYYFTYCGNSGNVKLIEFVWDKDTEQVFSGTALEPDYYYGKKITFLGDSITCGVGASNTTTERYSTVLTNTLGAIENNMGNSGWVISTDGIRNSQLQNISKIPTDSDLVIVMLGTNDYDLANNSQYTLGTDGDTTTSTVWGATEAMCKALAERFEGTDTRIIICTPIIRKGQSNERINSAGYTLRDLSNVLMTCARRNGLLYCDLNASEYLTDSDMNDTLHPNTSGHNKIAQYLTKYILSGYNYYIPYEN